MNVWINAKGNMATELAIKENKKKAKLINEELILDNLHKYLDVFDENKANWFPESNMCNHKIDMKAGFEPKSFKNYNLTPEEQKELDKFFDENLEKGYIFKHLNPPWPLPSSSSKRKMESYDLAKIIGIWMIGPSKMPTLNHKIMDKLKRAKYFSKFNVWWGYNNVWIWSGDEWKAAFKTNQGPYKPAVMFFGMCNSPATFQAMMDEMFKKEIKGNLIIVYMDNVLGFSKTIDRLKKIEWIVLEKAWEHDLFFKAKKCKFRKQKIKYLGLVVQEGKLVMDSEGNLRLAYAKDSKRSTILLGIWKLLLTIYQEFLSFGTSS